MGKENKIFEFPSGWLFKQPEFWDAMNGVEQNHWMEQDEETILGEERRLMKPYLDIFKGRQVPRSELNPVFDEAIISGIENGTLNQGINEQNEIVVFKVEPKK